MKKFLNVTSVITNLLHKMVSRCTRQRGIYIDANTETQYFLAKSCHIHLAGCEPFVCEYMVVPMFGINPHGIKWDKVLLEPLWPHLFTPTVNCRKF